MRVFICGIIQGSLSGLEVHGQSYRDRLRRMLRQYLPWAEIYCPVSLHPQSPTYDDARAFQVLEESVQAARRSHLVIAYVPEASMGSAIEMWEAKKAGAKIITVTALRQNWVVRYASDLVVESLDQLEAAFKDLTVSRLLQ